MEDVGGSWRRLEKVRERRSEEVRGGQRKLEKVREGQRRLEKIGDGQRRSEKVRKVRLCAASDPGARLAPATPLF